VINNNNLIPLYNI